MSHKHCLLALCLLTLGLSGCASAKRAWNWVWGEPRMTAPIEPPPPIAVPEAAAPVARKAEPAATTAPATDMQQIPAEEIVGGDRASDGELIDDSAQDAAAAAVPTPAPTASAQAIEQPALPAPMTQPSATAEPAPAPAAALPEAPPPAQPASVVAAQPASVATAQPASVATAQPASAVAAQPASVAPPPPAVTAAPPAAAAETLTLQTDALFPFGKSDLTSLSPVGKQRLDALVARLKELDPGHALAIQVTGHADRLGAAHRITLVSQQRAEAVKAYLAQQGIEANRITAIGKGASEPKARCRNFKLRSKLIACLAPDRRVEVSIAARR